MEYYKIWIGSRDKTIGYASISGGSVTGFYDENGNPYKMPKVIEWGYIDNDPSTPEWAQNA